MDETKDDTDHHSEQSDRQEDDNAARNERNNPPIKRPTSAPVSVNLNTARMLFLRDSLSGSGFNR